MKVSLIIPIYKAETFLPRLFENLESQGVFFDDKEFGEAIFVNDGSPDNSESIILEYGKRHPWVRLIRQENQGQHIARNTGIKAANGEYIAFMDQDDAYSTNALKCLYDVISFNKVSIVRGGSKSINNDNYCAWVENVVGSPNVCKLCSGVDFLVDTNGLIFSPMVWGAMYDRNFIVENNVFFEEEFNVYEDGAFNWKLMLKANKVAILDNVVYFWIQRSDSESHNLNREHILLRSKQTISLVFFYNRLLKRVGSINNIPDRLCRILRREMLWSLFCYFMSMIKLRGLRKSEIIPIIRRLKEESIYPYPSSYPKDLPDEYPSFLHCRILWRLLSYEWILKMILRIRSRR